MSAEPLFESQHVAIVRLNARPREAVEGRHKRAVVYVAATVSVGELVRLLDDTSERLERSLARVVE